MAMIDPGSETWKAVSVWGEENLQTFREQNDNQSLSAIKTAVLRGKIEILKDLMDLPKPKPEIVAISELETDIF
jgi:hypothetical protein